MIGRRRSEYHVCVISVVNGKINVKRAVCNLYVITNGRLMLLEFHQECNDYVVSHIFNDGTWAIFEVEDIS